MGYEFRMIISCPACSARYAVDATKIGPRGRTVKCAKCAHTWLQPPPEDPAAGAPPTAAAPATARDAEPAARRGASPEAAPESAGDAPDADEPEISAEDFRATFDAAMERDRADQLRAERPDDSRDTTRRPGRTGRPGLPAVRRKRSRWPARLAWLLLIAVVGGVIGGAAAFRDAIVETWAPAKQLYDLIGLAPEPIEKRLGVRNVKRAWGTGAEANVLTIEGEIVNISDAPSDVPGLRVLFLNNAGDVISRWPFAAPEKRMLPDETVKFSTRIVSPPTDAKHIDVGFDVEYK